MSTSHYSSRPNGGSGTPGYIGPTYGRVIAAPNRRKWTAGKLAIIGGLLLVDLAALAGSKNITESLILVGLVLVNLWAINYTRPC